MLNPFTRRKVLKNGMPGRATIVEMSMPESGASSQNIAMTLQVHCEGITPYEVEGQWMVSRKDPIGFGLELPVKVDKEDHNKVAIDWDAARGEDTQRTAARREALAGGGAAASGASAMQGAAPVIDMRGDPELRAKVEQVLGRKLEPGTTETLGAGDPQLQMQIMQVVQQHMAEKATSGATGFAAAPGGAASGEDDKIGQVERLAQLKSSGALTDEEFEKEKARILGES